MACHRPRALHLHVLGALGVAWTGVALSTPVPAPPAASLAALDGRCLATPGGMPGSLPVTFEPAAPGSRFDFIARNPGRALALDAAGPIIDVRAHRVRLFLANANLSAKAVPECASPTRSHYFVGEPGAWRRDVPHFHRVRYQDARPGIDIAYYGRDGTVEYDIIARPGSDPASLSFAISGGDSAAIDANGDLVIATASGEVRHHRPVAFQRAGEAIERVAASYVLTHDPESLTWNVGFELGAYDPGRELVIDPVLSYSTFIGSSGSSSESGGSVALDPTGKLIFGGQATSTAIGASGTANIEVYKIDTAANTVVFSTILGGSGSDTLDSLVVDAAGNIYLAGNTGSADFPRCFATSDCATRSGPSDVYAMRLDGSGVPNYSMLVGGSGSETSGGIAVDASGRIVIAGRTTSADFPTVDPINASYLGGSGDIFVARIDPTPAGGIDFSTFLGSSADDFASAVAVDGAGNIYLGGSSNATFPTVNPAQAFAGGSYDGIAMKIVPPPSASVAYATFVGGSGSDGGVAALAVDPLTGHLLAGGSATAGMFTTPGAPQPSSGGGSDAFVVRYDASGALLFATYLGASGSDNVRAIVPDGSGGLYFAGLAGGGAFPQVNPVPGALTGPSTEFNGYVAHIDQDGALDLATLLGGSGTDLPRSLARGADGSLWVGGTTFAPTFPMVTPQRGTMFGSADFFAARLSFPRPYYVFNTDARSDVLWRDTTGGLNYQWQMNGLALSGQGYMLTVPSNWAVAAIGDANGDGGTDVLWREAGGLNYLWLVNGLTISAQGYLPTVPNPWIVVGMGDANGDGRADVFWRNPSTGQNYLWQMNGVSIGSQGYLPNVAGTDWEAVGVADYNGDGRADVFWRNKTTGQNYLWIMNGLSVASQGYLPTVVDTNWEVAGSPDTNGDTRADVMWRNKVTGQNYLWRMNGMTLSSQGYLAGVADTNWKVVGYGDYNGDGKGDVLWRNATTGQNFLWTLNGYTVTSQGYLPNVNGANWQPVKR